MATQDEITQQQQLLVTHRQTLAVYVARQARQGLAHVDPEVIHGIREAREQIQRVKSILRNWSVAVEDHPDDAAPPTDTIGVATHASPTTSLPTGIPDDRYYPLPGRERLLSTMVNTLIDTSGPSMIVITGLGGLGKTAAAAEISRRLLQEHQFEAVIGDSAKEQLFAGGDIVQLRKATLDFDALLDSIARQLGRWEIPTLKAAEKRSVIGRLLQQHRYLLLVDNLETAENAQALVTQVRAHLGRSRALVTSRERVVDDRARPFVLSELDAEDSVFFIETDAAQRGVEQLIGAPRDLLLDIHHVTGGAPLALKLVVAQARFFDVRLVLDQLRQRGAKLYTYIYRRAWEQLSPATQRALIYIGQTVVTTVSWSELRAVEIAEGDEELMAAIDQLIAYSLLNVIPTDGTLRYGIHQLTRQFVTSGLPELWQEQGLL
jgi:hypothetical protein